jgi:hypothetical protein
MLVHNNSLSTPKFHLLRPSPSSFSPTIILRLPMHTHSFAVNTPLLSSHSLVTHFQRVSAGDQLVIPCYHCTLILNHTHTALSVNFLAAGEHRVSPTALHFIVSLFFHFIRSFVDINSFDKSGTFQPANPTTEVSLSCYIHYSNLR